MKLPKKILNFPEIGKVAMRGIGMEKRKMLKEFYINNYFKNYILAKPKLFNWMFKNNGGQVAVLLSGDKIIAHQGHIPVIFTNGKNDYKGFISASTMVDAGFRRRGLMSHLRGNVQNQYEMAISLGGSDMGIALYSSMGYKNYGNLIHLVAIIDPKRCVGIVKSGAALKRNAKLGSGDKGGQVKFIKKFEEIKKDIERLWESVFSGKKYFCVKRNAEFLDWRYAEHPIFKYERYGFWDKGELRALIVFRKELPKGAKWKTIRIVELIGTDDAIPELIKATVLNSKISSDVGWADWLCSNKHICQIVERAGFVSPEKLLPAKIPLLCNPINYEKKGYPVMLWSKNNSLHKRMIPLNEWYITKGDGDADRPN